MQVYCARVKLGAVSEPGWRNWQTQRTQNPPRATSWGFDPPSRHQQNKGFIRKIASSRERPFIIGGCFDGCWLRWCRCRERDGKEVRQNLNAYDRAVRRIHLDVYKSPESRATNIDNRTPATNQAVLPAGVAWPLSPSCVISLQRSSDVLLLFRCISHSYLEHCLG